MPQRTAVERLNFAMLFAGDWCGGTRSLGWVMGLQRSGGNGPNPDWSSSRLTRVKARPQRRARRAKRFEIDDITKQEPPSMRRRTERPAKAA